MVEPAWNPQRALRRQQPTAVLHRDDDHPGQREENPPVARPRLRKRSLGGNVRSAATTLKHFSRPLRSEEHTSELQSLMRISYAVFCLKQKNVSAQLQTTHHTLLIS